MLKAVSLYKQYEAQPILQDVSLTVAEAENKSRGSGVIYTVCPPL